MNFLGLGVSIDGLATTICNSKERSLRLETTFGTFSGLARLTYGNSRVHDPVVGLMEITLILTEDCNLRCTYCYQKQFTPTAMPLRTAMAALRSAIDAGSDSLTLTFFGGEPLLQSTTMFQILAAARHLERRTGGPEACGSCGVRDRCNRSCDCINLRGTGQVNAPPASLCETEQTNITAIDRIAADLFRQGVPEFVVRQYSCSYHALTAIEKMIESMGVEDEHIAAR